MYLKYFAFDFRITRAPSPNRWFVIDYGNVRGGIGGFYFRIGPWA